MVLFFKIMRLIEIDAAHRVPEHNSGCKHLHGHRYKIEAHCIGKLAMSGEEGGMVMDFKFLKELMMQRIHGPCDHGMILRYDDMLLGRLIGAQDHQLILDEFKRGRKNWEEERWSEGLRLLILPFVPTAENLAYYWFNCLELAVKERSDGRAHLHKVLVWETPNCYAEYVSPTPVHFSWDLAAEGGTKGAIK